MNATQLDTVSEADTQTPLDEITATTPVSFAATQTLFGQLGGGEAFEDFYGKFGVEPQYCGKDVLDWLGY